MIRRGGNRERDRGAAMVEAALAGPIVFVLIFAILEFGLVFRDMLTAADAVADAARIGAIVGPDIDDSGSTADFQIVKALREGLAGVPIDSIERIVVFAGRSPGGGGAAEQVPAQCKQGVALAGRCNVYDPRTAFNRVQEGDTAYFRCRVTPSSPACSWPPERRDDGPDTLTIDYVGVWVRIEHQYFTGLFGDAVTIDRAVVIRLEPGFVE